MSWLNLNSSLNNLKGQITTFASEVLSETSTQNSGDTAAASEPTQTELVEKCRNQEIEIAALKKLNEELEASLQAERIARKNGIKEEESSWYWDPPSNSEPVKKIEDIEMQYQSQIRALQEEISTLRQDCEMRFENDEMLLRVTEENKKLSSNLEELDSQHQVAMERLLALKKELQKNFEGLKQEHEEIKALNDDYAVQVQDLLFKIEEKEKEIENYKSSKLDHDTLSHKYQNLERIHSLLRENAEKFQEENQELNEENFRLQEQVTKLEHDVDICLKEHVPNTVPKEKYDELLRQIDDFKTGRSNHHDFLDEINIDDDAKSVIESLKREILELKRKLTQKDSLDQEIDHKVVKPEKIMQLYNKYVNFDLPLDYLGEIPSSGDIVLYKLESVFKIVNKFKKDIDNLEHQLAEKNLNVTHLQTQVEDLTAENEFITADMQHYERELSEMKKNNDFLISEIAALKNTSKLEPIMETHEDNLIKLESELADSTKLNKTFESELKRIGKELSEVTKEKSELHASLKDLKDKYMSMLNELDTLKTQTKAVEELENNSSYAEKLNKTSDEIDDLRKRLNNANAKIEQLSIDNHIIENDKVILTKEVSDLKHELTQKISGYNELQIKLQELTKHVETHQQNQAQHLQYNHDVEFNNTKINESAMEGHLKQMETMNTTLKEENIKLSQEMNDMKSKEKDLLNEIDLLKNDLYTETLKAKELFQTIEGLRLNVTELDQSKTELDKCKYENKVLVERKIQLETELSQTDNKVVKLEEEFEKLLSDLNEKDAIIDNLNALISQTNTSLTNLKQNVTDLENSVQIKNQEIINLQKLLEIEKESNESSININNEELLSLRDEKSNVEKQIVTLKAEISEKDLKNNSLHTQINDLAETLSNYKILLENKDKEIKELNQSLIELKEKSKVIQNTTQQDEDHVSELQHNLTFKEIQIVDLKQKYEQLEKSCAEYKTVWESATAEKTELINLINLKHNESLQYHNEIQRLNQVILEQTNEFKRIIEEKEKLSQNTSLHCHNCENLQMTLKEKDSIIMNLNKNNGECEKLKSELYNATEMVKSLTDKCQNLNKTVSELAAEKVQLSEREQNCTRELERLRRHLVELEENYTAELMTSEQKLSECQARLQQQEERVKQTSTIYTSNSIRANQEVETLRNQIKLLEKQRDEVQQRLSDAEDARNRSEAALTNLQVVLEQFQMDKDREIEMATELIRNKMDDVKREKEALQHEITKLNAKLEESMAGLKAATRLGDQLETKTAQINDLKDQVPEEYLEVVCALSSYEDRPRFVHVKALQTSVAAAEERYYNAINNQQDRVDKNLVKNLVINYAVTAATNSTNRTQVLRILSTVLDFNQKECEKLGLVRSTNSTESLAAEFVKFLQYESTPRAPLPNMMTLTQSTSRSTTPSSRKNSTLGPQPISETGHQRNPSTGSNNLLFQNLEAVETTSQISHESETNSIHLETGVNQTRNTEGAILKHVLKDM